MELGNPSSTTSDIPGRAPTQNPAMFLQFRFGADRAEVQPDGPGLRIALTNPALGEDAHETWELRTGGTHRRSGRFFLQESETLLCGAATIDVCPETLEAETLALYRELLALTKTKQIYRIWNFLPAINEVPAGTGLENYRTFCKARSHAFEEAFAANYHSALPSASAVGTADTRLTVVFLAGTDTAAHLENPRQTPAYEYPADYGPRAPSFARATVMETAGQPFCFISGTASIRGHQSIGHTAAMQLEATIENLNIISDEFFRKYPDAGFQGGRRIRVYLRDEQDTHSVREQLTCRYLRPNDQVTYVRADICREELALEIEVSSRSMPGQ